MPTSKNMDSGITKIKRLIATEDEIIARLSKEVTADPPLTSALIRAAAYRRCVDIMEQKK